MTKNIICIRNLSKRFNTKYIIKNLYLTLKKGSINIFIGQNGCGKSTLLKILSGIDSEYSGRIISRAQKISYIPQNPGEFIIPWLDVKENMILDKQFSEKELDNIITKAGLRKNQSGHLLSGGEKQVLLVARTLLQKPDVLIIDEPLASLDAVNKERIKKILSEFIHRYNITVIMSAHKAIDTFFLKSTIHIIKANRITRDSLKTIIYCPRPKKVFYDYVRCIKNEFKELT